MKVDFTIRHYEKTYRVKLHGIIVNNNNIFHIKSTFQITHAQYEALPFHFFFNNIIYNDRSNNSKITLSLTYNLTASLSLSNLIIP